MTPDKIASAGTEHSQQCAFFCAIREYQSAYPQLAFIHAIPNGGQRNVATASRLVAEGVKSGVPDVFFPFANNGWHGLYLEFKRPGSKEKTKGKTSKQQDLWAQYLISQNYLYFVVYEYLTAVQVVLNYLK